MKKILLIVTLFAVTIISAFIIYNAYPSVNQLGAIQLKYNSIGVTRNGNRLLEQLNLNIEGKTEITTLQANRELLKSVYDAYSFSEANNLIRERIPGYYWELEWKKPDENVTISSNEPKSEGISAGDIILNYDTHGRLLLFKRQINDSLKLNPVTEDEAHRMALDFLKSYSPVDPEAGPVVMQYKSTEGFGEKKVQKIEKQNNIDYKFSWKARSADINRDLLLNVIVTGDIITSYTLSFDITGIASQSNSSIYSVATAVPFYLIVYIIIIIIGYKRIRAYEVSFRLAIVMGLIVGFTFSVNLYTLIADSSTGWELWLPLFFSTIFLAAGVLVSWAVSETIARETWKQKFISLDLLTKGYAFHSKVSRAGIKGLIGGFLIYLVWLVILFTSEKMMHISFITKDSPSLISHFHSISPALSIIDRSIYPGIYSAAIFFLFVFSGLKRRFSSLYILIPISAVLWGVVNYNDMLPTYWGVITGVVMGLVFMLYFNYSDVLSAIITLVVFNTIDVGASLFTAGNAYYQQAGYHLIIFFILLTVFLVIGLLTRDKISDYDSITPAFVKNITERQRLQRELEIARDVQMSFLPVKNPEFKGLDIAARCKPALEVGGDYYDFVQLDANRIGIIIGDVSGKGTQAAFYMTLAKGFVKALSKTVSSPSEFLIKINELFYENVERGTFISMIYGIFDVKDHTLTFSRAGHNPVIAKHSGKKELELLNPVGLALGLEKGRIFNKTIKEIKIDTHPGDAFVFYTDGFTEAMNRFKMEFTETRLTESISKNLEFPAKELLDKTIADVDSFIGKALQHDDMTMVVVKVE